jgi:hypothetical protein
MDPRLRGDDGRGCDNLKTPKLLAGNSLVATAKKKPGFTPGELNREVSRLGDVGSEEPVNVKTLTRGLYIFTESLGYSFLCKAAMRITHIRYL